MRRLGILLCLPALLLACGSSNESFTRAADVPLEVKQGTFQSRLSLSGSLVAKDSTSVNAPTDGYGLVIRWMATEGIYVKKGDKVIEMETSAVASQIEALESSVVTASNAVAQQLGQHKIDLAEKKHTLRQAEFNLAKAKEDAAVPADAYPKRVYEDMQLALGRSKVAHTNAVEALAIEGKVGKSNLAQKRIELERAKRNLGEAYEKLEGYVLRAPRDGLLVPSMSWRDGRPFRDGDKTWPGQPIVEIPDLSVMTIKAELSDVDDGQVHVGMGAECRLDAYPDQVFVGSVVSISPVARKAKRDSLRAVFDVVVELESTDTERMRPGMSARIDLLGAKREDVLIAPRAALAMENESITATLASGKRLAVTLGPCNPLECIVESGLERGAKLARRGRL